MSYRSRQPTIQSAPSAAKAEGLNQRPFPWVWGRKEGLNNHLLRASKIARLLPECQKSPAIGEGSLQHRLLWPPWIFKGMHWVENISNLEHCGKWGDEFPASQLLTCTCCYPSVWCEGHRGQLLWAGHMSQCCWQSGGQSFAMAAPSLVTWALGEPCHADMAED